MIRIYQPFIARNQKQYINEAIDSNEMTYRGSFHNRFEHAIADHLKVKNVILTPNGTVSLYAAYREIFTSYPKCFIITPTITYASTVSQIKLLGFTPLYIDCDENLQININQLQEAIKMPGISGCVIAQLYGNSPDIEKITKICKENKVPLVEDSAEAFSCWKNNKAIGTFGDVGSFSFFANKTITSGEGGCLVTNDDNLADKIRRFCNCNTSGGYKHQGLGTNFRMTNYQAALGLAQLEEIDYIIHQKQQIAEKYRKNIKFRIIENNGVDKSSYWMNIFKLGDHSYPKFLTYCTEKGIEVRPAFFPLHQMPEFDGYIPFKLNNALDSINNYFILPCYPTLSVKDQEYIIEIVNEFR